MELACHSQKTSMNKSIVVLFRITAMGYWLTLAALTGCSKKSSTSASNQQVPFFQYTAQWNSSDSSLVSGGVTVDTFSISSVETGGFIYDEISPSGTTVSYQFNGYDSSSTAISSLSCGLTSFVVKDYHADSSTILSATNKNGDFLFVSAAAQIIGKDTYNALVSRTGDYFDLNITSISSDSLASGTFSGVMTAFRTVSPSLTIVTPGGYVIKDGIFKNIKISQVQPVAIH